MHRCT